MSKITPATLVAWREDNDLSIAKAARYFNVSWKTYRRMETGLTPPETAEARVTRLAASHSVRNARQARRWALQASSVDATALRAWRAALGLTQVEAAARLGICLRGYKGFEAPGTLLPLWLAAVVLHGANALEAKAGLINRDFMVDLPSEEME